MDSFSFQTLWTSPFSVAIVAIIFGCLTGMVTVIAKQWRKARETEMEAALKGELIKQGRSGEEIERILRASSKPPKANEDE